MKARCYICAGDADISPYTEHEKAVKRIQAGTYRGQPLRYTAECWRCTECESHEFYDPDQAQAMALNIDLAKMAIDSALELKVVK